MRITTSGINMEISDALRERIEKKVAKLNRYLRDDAEVQVKLSQERGARNRAEITINFGGAIIRAEEISNDMYASIDSATDKVIRKIRKHRTKLDKRLRVGAFEAEAGAEPEPIAEEEDAASLVRVKRFAVKPMPVEDAIAQMDMLGHSFFLFLNLETDGMCVVYRRDDGNYGLLEPENA